MQVRPQQEVVEIISTFWANNTFMNELSMLEFYVNQFPSQKSRDQAVKKAMGDIADRLLERDLVEKTLIEKLRNSSAKSAGSAIAEIKKGMAAAIDAAFKELDDIPPSTSKAASWLETEFQRDLEPFESVIWKKFPPSDALDRVRKYRDGHGEIRPNKRSQQSIECSRMSDYLIALGLSNGQTDKYVKDLEWSFRNDLTEIHSSWTAHFDSQYASFELRPQFLSPTVLSVSFSLWLWTSSERFVELFRPELDRIIPLLLKFTLSNGALWQAVPTSPSEPNGKFLDYAPKASVPATALFANSLFAIKRDEWIESHAVPACEWLASEQMPDGGWRMLEGKKADESDTLTTLLCVDALQNCDGETYATHITHGREFLLDNQVPSGAWTNDYLDDAFFTRKVLEHFQNVGSSRSQGTLGDLVSTSREFLLIAKELLSRGTGSNYKLAVIALAHSLEFNLYSILAHEDVGVDYYDEKSADKTIGAREAMRKLKEHLVIKGSMSSTTALKYQTQLRSMLSKRDSVVHKNHSVSQIELARWVNETEGFIAHYRREVLGE